MGRTAMQSLGSCVGLRLSHASKFGDDALTTAPTIRPLHPPKYCLLDRISFSSMLRQYLKDHANPSSSFSSFTNMRPSAVRTIAIYTCISLSVLLCLILFATHGLPPFAEDSINSFSYPRPPPAHPIVAHEYPEGYNGRTTGEQTQHDHTYQTYQGDWRYDYARDGKNYGLSEEQCNLAFPELYEEVDRAVAYRRAVGQNVSLQDMEVGWRGDGIVRAMIRDNQLYVIDAHGVRDSNHRPRSIASLHSLHRAVTAYPGKLPNIEFTLTDHDSALGKGDNHTTWAYSRLPEQETLWLMPDFGLWGWPNVGLRSYAELQSVLDENEDDFLDKQPKLVWRGALGNAGGDIRRALIKESKDQEWSDVQSLSWKNKTDLRSKILSMEDHCGYMFVAQTEGNTYSGRLKYLLNCHSIVMSHELRWLEHYHHLLIDSGPGQNFIKLKRDFSDLRSTMRRILQPAFLETTARGIADNARATFREKYLTPAANACYWRAMIRGWASVQGFEPQLWIDEEVDGEPFVGIGPKKRKRRPRGTPFESYAIMEVTEWSLPARPRVICIDREKEEL